MAQFMQESVVFLVRVQCRGKESSRSLSHLLMSFLYLMFLQCYCMRKCLSVKQLDCEKMKVLERFMLPLYFVFYNVPANKTNVINLLLGLLCAFMTIS